MIAVHGVDALAFRAARTARALVDVRTAAHTNETGSALAPEARTDRRFLALTAVLASPALARVLFARASCNGPNRRRESGYVSSTVCSRCPKPRNNVHGPEKAHFGTALDKSYLKKGVTTVHVTAPERDHNNNYPDHDDDMLIIDLDYSSLLRGRWSYRDSRGRIGIGSRSCV